MLNAVGTLALIAFAAALLGAAAAKAIAVRHRSLSWPDPSLAGVRIPVGVVIAVEAAAAMTVLVLPAPWQAAVGLAVVYGMLSGAAWRLRGKACGCFGSRSSVVGPGHVAGTITACAVSAVLVPFLHGGWGLPVTIRAPLLAVITLGVVLFARSNDAEPASPPLTDPAQEESRLAGASAILVLTGDHCPHCAALKVILHGRLRDHAVRWVDLEEAPKLASVDHASVDYQEMAQGRVPCAVAVDDAWLPVSEPRWGTRDIPWLADQFLIATAEQSPRPVHP